MASAVVDGTKEQHEPQAKKAWRPPIPPILTILPPSFPWTQLLKRILFFGSISRYLVSNLHLYAPEYDGTWQSILSILVLKLLNAISFPLELIGRIVEWFPNFISFNHGLFSIFTKLLLFRYDRIIWFPPKDSPQYLSVVGILDPRKELLHPTAQYKETNTVGFVDLAVMTSKLAYESEQVQRDVVDNTWKMNYRKFYNCWNDRAQSDTTQAFVFTDKKSDADVIFLAFRGTEPFSSLDWATDFDFSFAELGMGRVHVGFLEALGLVNRQKPETFAFFHQNSIDLKSNWRYFGAGDLEKFVTGLVKSNTNERKTLAFDAIKKDLVRLLQENPKAKLYITGHSLGAALAIVFAGILMYKQRTEKEDDVLRKLSAIHTFGQPRFCDKRFGKFMQKQMEEWKIDYYRIVYCNDMVCRIPFDDPIFGFKHVGRLCYYYDSCFKETVSKNEFCCYYDSCVRQTNLEEVPNKNFFSVWYVVPMWANAMWELVRGLVLGVLLNGKDYREGIATILLRIVGLVHPGVADHMPVNYVNAVRLGPAVLVKEHRRMHDS